MAKDKKNVTNAMRLLNASKIKYETVEYEADAVSYTHPTLPTTSRV